MTGAPSHPGDALVAAHYDDDERTALRRVLHLATPGEFLLVAVEVPSPEVRDALCEWLARHDETWRFRTVSLASLPGRLLVEEIPAALARGVGRSKHAALLLTGLESVEGASLEPSPSLFLRLNLERDRLVQALPMPWLLLAHPEALLKLRTVAPDFSHYVSTQIRARPVPQNDDTHRHASWSEQVPTPSTFLGVADSDWPTLLRDADDALQTGDVARARDRLAEFGLTGDADAWRDEAELLTACAEGFGGNIAAGLARLKALTARQDTLRDATAVRSLCKYIDLLEIDGEAGEAARAVHALKVRAQKIGRADLVAEVALEEALACMGVDRVETLRLARHALHLLDRSERQRLRWEILKLIATQLRMPDEAVEAHRIYREEMLPIARDLLRDPGLEAATYLHLAETLQAEGRQEVSLEVLRCKVLPVGEARRETLAVIRARLAIAGSLRRSGRPGEALAELRALPPNAGPFAVRALVAREAAEVLAALGDFAAAAQQMDVVTRELLTLDDPHTLVGSAGFEILYLLRLGLVREARGVYDRVSTHLAERGHWEALAKLDAPDAAIRRAESAAPRPRKRRR